MRWYASLVAAVFATQAGALEIRQSERAMNLVRLWNAAGLETGLKDAAPVSRSASLRCGSLVVEKESGNDHYAIHTGDLNNDGKDDFTVVRRCAGDVRRDLIVGLAQRDGDGWGWTSFKDVLIANGIQVAELPAQIDPIQFPREMSTGSWVMPFLTETWFLKNGKLTAYRPEQLKGSANQ